jgi:hypothetical protein
MVPGMAGMVPFSWCGTSGGVSTYIHAKKNVHSGPAFQDTSVLWRSKCSKTSPVLCGEDAVSQLFAPNGKIPQRHTIYIPSLTIFTKKGFQKRLAFAVDTGQAHGISPRVHDTAYMLRFVPGGTPDEFCHTSSTQ